MSTSHPYERAELLPRVLLDLARVNSLAQAHIASFVQSPDMTVEECLLRLVEAQHETIVSLTALLAGPITYGREQPDL